MLVTCLATDCTFRARHCLTFNDVLANPKNGDSAVLARSWTLEATSLAATCIHTSSVSVLVNVLVQQPVWGAVWAGEMAPQPVSWWCGTTAASELVKWQWAGEMVKWDGTGLVGMSNSLLSASTPLNRAVRAAKTCSTHHYNTHTLQYTHHP